MLRMLECRFVDYNHVKIYFVMAHYFLVMRISAIMKIRKSALLFFVILLGSCASNKNNLIYQDVQETDPHSGFVYDENIELEISFVGVMDERYVFETVITNLSEYDISVHASQFVMRHQGMSIVHTEDLKTTIQEVAEDQKKLTKRRKFNNLINGIGVGIGLLVAITTGTPTTTTLLSSLEPTLYIVDENLWISKDIQSSDEYISYLQTAQYDNDVIASGASLTKDLFFNVFEINQDIEIEFLLEALRYSVFFPQMAFSY